MSGRDTRPATLSEAYFDNVYARSDDPWSFATSAYEAEKYAASLAALAPRYGPALEIGCSIGIFTAELAARCDLVLGVDISARAIELARIRCAHVPNVQLEQRDVTEAFPTGPFDLVTVCEVGYYWSDRDLERMIGSIAGVLPPGGDVLLVHFLPVVDDYVRPGDEVHEWFLRDSRFQRVAGSRAERYRIDVVRRR